MLDYLIHKSAGMIQFNSLLFIGGFLLFYFLYALFYQKTKIRNFLLLVFSLLFYYKLSGIYVLLLIGLAFFQYVIALQIGKNTKENIRNVWYWTGISFTLLILVFFKYAPELSRYFHMEMVWNIFIPIGISYYVFKSISYLTDCVNELIEEPEKSFVDYLLYMSLFTTIIAGPIAKARNVLPQLKSSETIPASVFYNGMFLILAGIIKKYIIADYLWANYSANLYAAPQLFGGIEHLLNLYVSAFHFYLDFSGYTDMMLGISFLLGLSIEPNFNRPFVADSITEFWKRWHISLSTWLSEYLYTPMSFYLRGMKKWGVAIAAILTFFISGIWHGLKLTFIAWGLIHGFALAYEVATKKLRGKISRKIPKSLYRFISAFITFHVVAFSILVFDASSLTIALEMVSKIFNAFDPEALPILWENYKVLFAFLAFAVILHFSSPVFKEKLMSFFNRSYWVLKPVIIALVILVAYQFYSAEAKPFIYTQF